MIDCLFPVIILKFLVKYVLISRIEIDDIENCYTYEAYDEITTYKYIHSKDNLLNHLQLINF